jgi:oligopeptidase B
MIENIQPPIAKIIPTELENSGTLELIIILVKEKILKSLTTIRKMIMKNDSHAWISKELFEEMKARIKENDESVPYLYNVLYYPL